MADIRCPMCSTMNHEAAEVCSNCQARLVPLIAGTPSSDSYAPESEGSTPPQSDVNEGDEDWLAKIRADAVMGAGAEEEGPAADEADEAAPDWLGRLREADSGIDEGPPPEEIPEWMDDFLAAGDDEEEAEEVPEWLERVRARKETPADAQPEADEGDDWLTQKRDDAPAEQPTGLEELKPSADVDDSVEQPASEALDLGPLPEIPEVAAPHDEIVHEQAIPSPEADDFVPSPEHGEESPPISFEPAIPAEEMEWFPPPEERELQEAEGLPHVPALVDDEDGEIRAIEIDDLNLDSVDLPDWLGELKSETPLVPEEPSDAPDLAPATLPSWLEAMRPVDTFRSEVLLESDEVQAVESAGPLAGLRGVLMAEPVVAKPRSVSTAAARLEVTERQYAQAELLQRLVEEEEREIPPARAERRRLPVVRWVIGFILLLAVILPFAFDQLGIGGYALPTVVSRDLQPLIELVGSVPTDRPALVVFDYTPGYSGELDLVAGAMLEHLVMRSFPIITVSTRPTGPPLAEGMLNKIGTGYDAVNGEDYLHLGYLSGGPTAVQLFAIAPRSVVLTGYHLPDSLSDGSVWESPLLQDVQRLSDFSLVVVITAGTDTARTWAEQTHPWIAEKPLVMVLSAGAEPLVRPYFEASDPQVDGILTGLPAAVSYRQYSGLPLTTGVPWDAFGLGMLAVELILIAGVIYGVGLWLLRLRGR